LSNDKEELKDTLTLSVLPDLVVTMIAPWAPKYP
jgi:hypothetical protein